MAPIKFEEQIKDKLERRKVTPSADAWSKLSQQLDADEKRNKKSSFWWFGIAASIAALVFVSISYFGGQDKTTEENIIVKDKVEDAILPKAEDKTLNKNQILQQEELAATKKTEETKILDEKIEVQKSIILQKSVGVKSEKVIAKNSKEQQLPKTSSIQLKNKPEDLLTPKLEVEFNSVVDVLQNVKSSNKSAVTDQQIDSLLKLANRELLMEKTIKKGITVVDADKLLQDVEEDMGQSFRTRIYETLKSGYKEVKEAVVQRNND
ncbi:hypothetical protein BTO05_06645 [Winogradskyella sp. PC-19]|uniref:hypothetical protein n=1 Tax=unclassified Winogradskyella TaxID=2615021 RepID=UPI000B3C2A25|nr:MULTISPECIES: hypothetical protein [unclassified Winogradskyella]ARV09330.1 hypothetical protein BTO05_06645 [Winogradskyella sp. PC-19]RZN83143.1 MAG: hypothetical protein EVB12_02075 [Winogradskyella sp.]